MRCPKTRSGLRSSSGFSTAAEIPACLLPPPAAAGRHSPSDGVSVLSGGFFADAQNDIRARVGRAEPQGPCGEKPDGTGTAAAERTAGAPRIVLPQAATPVPPLGSPFPTSALFSLTSKAVSLFGKTKREMGFALRRSPPADTQKRCGFPPCRTCRSRAGLGRRGPPTARLRKGRPACFRPRRRQAAIPRPRGLRSIREILRWRSE